jgi:Tol biopolymer transport system component
MRRCLLLVAGLTTLVLGFVGSASATFPGSNGPILFRDDHPSSGIGNPLFRARPDGSHVSVLSKRPGLFSDWRPDGRRIAFDFFQRNGSEQIATMRRNGSDVKVITSGKGIHEVPSYSPSGRRLVFDASHQDPSSPNFQTHLWVMRADGSHAHRLAMASSGFDVEPRYAPNGRWIAFDRLKPIPNGQLQAAFLVSTTGKHRVHRLTPWSFSAEHPTWSPDSRWILYNSPEGTIQKIRPSGTGRQTIVAASDGFGGHKPWYSPDGTKILFMCDNRGTLPGPPADFNQDICVMNADGSHIVHVIDTPNVLENWPSWGPAAH